MQISPEDIQWVDEDPGISQRGGYGGSGHGMNRSIGRDSVPVSGRGRGIRKGQSRKDFLPSQNGIGKKAPDDIQLLHTDTLIKEVSEKRWTLYCQCICWFHSRKFHFWKKFGQVERVFGANHPDPVEIDKAKKVLKVSTILVHL